MKFNLLDLNYYTKDINYDYSIFFFGQKNQIFDFFDQKKILKIEDESKYNKYNYILKIGTLIGRNSFSFRITLKEYKQGLNASKYSLLLNQFGIDPNNFIAIINEIMINNFPLNLIETIFKNTEDINLKFHFLVIISKYNPDLTSNNHFLIIPKGLFFSQIRSKMWPAFINKLTIFYLTKLLNIKIKQINLIFILIVFYIYKLITIKLNFYKNGFKFYSKEERQTSVGNYYNFKTITFKTFCKYHFRCYKHENQFNFSNINDISNFINNKFDINYYENVKKILIKYEDLKKNVF